nr:reverse transcriptase domain-containing protein [Tanacetum cinerariifolium]
MRTRSSSNLPGESSHNPTSSNPKHRNRRHSKQPFILEESPVDTMADQRTMEELLRAPSKGYVEAIVVPPILAEQFELKHSLINMITSDQFFGVEKDNPHDHIRWGSPSLAQKRTMRSILLGRILFPNSSMNLLLACPHHGFTELHQLDTFYNALNPADQDSLNSAAGGNLLERRTQDVLTIIENKSKVRNSRNKSIVSQVKSSDANSSSSSEIAKLTHGVNQQTSACLAANGNTFLELHDNIQGYVSAGAVNYNQGNSGYRPLGVANQIRPSGFAQPNVQNNQNWFSQPQGYNRGNNFNQDSSYQAPMQQNQTSSKNKEPTHLRRSRRLEDQSTTREKARRERSKSRRKRSGHQETSSNSEYEEGSDDACEDLNSPYKRPKPTYFTQRITHFKYHKRAKLPWNIRVYEGNKDPEDHLDPKSIDSFKEPSQKFLEEFLQQKRYAKAPIEIHGIKRRQNEGLQAFMDWFKSESSYIKGVPSVLYISTFMHGHGHPKLAKKLNDKLPKTVYEMFERVQAFIRGEVAARSAEMVRPSQGDKGYVCSAWIRGPERARNRGSPREARRNMRVYTPYLRKDAFTPLTKTPKEILAMESISFPKTPPFNGTLEEQNLNKFRDYHKDIGHNTSDCYQLRKQIEEVVASRKLGNLVKDIRRNNQRNGNPGRNDVKKMQDYDDRFFRGKTPSLRSNRSSSNFSKGKKKQDGANGVCNNKISFAVQHHNTKDQNEKPRSSVTPPNMVPLDLASEGMTFMTISSTKNKERPLRVSDQRPPN